MFLAWQFVMGFAVFAGIAAAASPLLTGRRKDYCIAFSAGVLIYVLARMSSRAAGEMGDLVAAAGVHYPVWAELTAAIVFFSAGLLTGFLGLVYFERRFIGWRVKESVLPQGPGKQASLLIALSFGFYNLTQGMAVGAEIAWREAAFAWFLAFGFSLHNMTEGIRILTPITGTAPRAGHLLLLGMVSACPLWAGQLISARILTSKPAEVFFMALATGTTLYAVYEIVRAGRERGQEAAPRIGFLAGFVVALASEMLTISLYRIY